MIRVQRDSPPAIYKEDNILGAFRNLRSIQNEKNRQEVGRLLAPFQQGSFRRIVLESLKKQFNNKCAFCESQIGVASSGIVENFRPKSLFPKEAYSWNNLHLSCGICSFNKSDNYPTDQGEALLVDPCYDIPSDHFEYDNDGLIHSKTIKGQTTIKIFDLNREKLIYSRKSQLKQIFTDFKFNSFEEINELPSSTPYLGYIKYIFEKIQSIISSDTTDEEFENLLHRYFSYNTQEPIQNSNAEEKILLQKQKYSNIYIETVEIKNFKVIEHLKINLNSLSEDDEVRVPCAFFLGENGTGKSSILQAITLALLGKNYKEIISDLKIKPKDILRNGTSSGFVKLELKGFAPIKLSFSETKGILIKNPSRKTILLAYGSTRFPHKKFVQRDYRKGIYPNKGLRISNLFNNEVRLVNSTSWLHKLDDAEFNYIIDDVLRKILSLDKKESFKKGKRVEIISTPQGIKLSQLSDGYQSMISLICDMLEAILEIWDFDVEGASGRLDTTTFTGIVLLDELGNHLHPKWKMKVVSILREIFPRIQFIISTHEPLCIRGSYYGEVFVINTNRKDNSISVLDKEELPNHEGLPVDKILTSEFFGLSSTRDAIIEELFQEYYSLKGLNELNLTDDDRTRIKELQKELEKYQLLGENQRERIMLDAIDEFLSKYKSIKEKTNRKKASKELKDQLLEIWKNHKIDGNKV